MSWHTYYKLMFLSRFAYKSSCIYPNTLCWRRIKEKMIILQKLYERIYGIYLLKICSCFCTHQDKQKHEVAAKEEKKAILIICDVFLRLISKLQEKQSCIPVRKTRQGVSFIRNSFDPALFSSAIRVEIPYNRCYMVCPARRLIISLVHCTFQLIPSESLFRIIPIFSKFT